MSAANKKAAGLGGEAANDETFFSPHRNNQTTIRQAFALWSAHKIAVALPVLPLDLKPPAIREILRLLNAGLDCREAA